MFEKFKSETKITILVFTAGLIITGILITLIYYQKISFFGGGKLWLQPIPMTAITVYILLSATFIIFFLYSYLVEESPTSTILGVLRKKEKVSEKEINSYFSDYKLIKLRLVDLLNQKAIKEKNKHLVILKRGKIAAGFIRSYRNILGWTNFG